MVSIQALRAIAAMSVVLVHFEYVRVVLSGHPNDRLFLYPLASGVDLFFVISGFIMVYSSEDLFGTNGGWRIFLTRRISRILPLYWLATAAAMAVMSAPQNWQSVVQSLLFVPYRTDGTFFPTHAGGWTLNFEMFFYCIFACAIFLRRKFAVPAVGISLLSFVILGKIAEPVQFAPIAYWSDPIILEFIFGMMIAMLYKKNVCLPTALRICFIVFGAAAIWLSSGGPVPTGDRWLVWGIPAALIFIGSTLGRTVNFGWLTAPIKMLGDASYALYLFHPLVAAVIMTYWMDGPFGTKGLSYHSMLRVLSLGVFVSILLSIGLHRFFEAFATRFIRRVSSRWLHQKITAAATAPA
jgi:exopolysaccharide production protein ExoZ